jgi:acetyl esterase
MAFGIPWPDPRNEAHFGSDASQYPSMSTVAHIDAPHLPLLITYAELDPVQQQVQAGESFATFNHLSQVYSINIGERLLAQPILEFVRARQTP